MFLVFRNPARVGSQSDPQTVSSVDLRTRGKPPQAVLMLQAPSDPHSPSILSQSKRLWPLALRSACRLLTPAPFQGQGHAGRFQRTHLNNAPLSACEAPSLHPIIRQLVAAPNGFSSVNRGGRSKLIALNSTAKSRVSCATLKATQTPLSGPTSPPTALGCRLNLPQPCQNLTSRAALGR